MSFDLYLLPANEVKKDPEIARAFLEREVKNFSLIPVALDPDAEARKRRLANCFLRLKPSYRELPIDYAAIAEFEKIGPEEARRKYRYIGLNGSNDPPEAQVVICERHIVVHWYSGTSLDEMDALLAVLCHEGGFVVFDPQVDRILDARKGSIRDAFEP